MELSFFLPSPLLYSVNKIMKYCNIDDMCMKSETGRENLL